VGGGDAGVETTLVGVGDGDVVDLQRGIVGLAAVEVES
jgi:hypothetical protein